MSLGRTFASFGRTFSHRVLLAYLVPLSVTVALGSALAWVAGYNVGRVTLAELIILLPAVLIGRLLTRRDALRLADLRRSAERIERGSYSARLPVAPGGDEYSDLARAFNHMTDVLAARESALREQNLALASLNQRLESVLNATNDGVALLSRDGKFVLVNRRFGEMVGARSDTLLGHAMTDAPAAHILERLAEPERVMHQMAALTAQDLAQPVGVAEEVIETFSPDRRYVQVYTAPVQGEGTASSGEREVIGRIIALRDVTREKELDKMKTDFISVVSHELRTPLTSIKGYTDLLLSGAADGSTELQHEFLSIIQGSTTRLSNLINDILDISRIESGKIDIKHEPIDYRKIVSDTLRLMRAAADEKVISMDASLPETMPPVRGDADKVTQVLSNLVSNAIKYTPPGGWIKVLLEVTGDASVTTCVQDSGIGIAPEDQKKLFQKFFRADNTSTREAGGTGLGLVIAKTIVELLGGAIWVESEPGRGSRFYFTLPLSAEKNGVAALPPETVTLPDRGIGLVMVVDDDTYVRGLVQHHLHRRGYGTIGAGDAAEALQKARQHKPDVVTLDMMMPQMAGFSILRALKGDPATASIPVVIVSVVGDPARGALSLGAFSFVQKPIDEHRLAVSIADAMNAARPASEKDNAVVLHVGHALPSAAAADMALLVEKLAAHHITLHLSATPEDALAFAVTRSPDLILLDMAMPDAALFDLLSALKAEEEAARIPVLLMTEDISDEGIHFHLGGDADGHAVSLDYICEQLGRVLARPDDPASPSAAAPLDPLPLARNPAHV